LTKLVVAFGIVELAFAWTASLGVTGMLVFVPMAIGLAYSLERSRWRSFWTYVLGCWLLPSAPTLLLVFFGWKRGTRARPGSRLHRSDARSMARPIVVWFGLLGVLASRPPHDDLLHDRIATGALGALAVGVGCTLVVLDLVDFLVTRALARGAAGAAPAPPPPEPAPPSVDFGVEDVWAERVEASGDPYRDASRRVTYRGSAVDAVRLLAGSLAWSAGVAVFALAAAGVMIAQSV
jgi:hypothetical protein